MPEQKFVKKLTIFATYRPIFAVRFNREQQS